MSASYRQFCPVAMAAEVLESRWTLLIVRELCLGSKHFNDIRKGVPKMSPTLLSKRLKELEWHGILNRVESPRGSRKTEYVLTEAGDELFEVIHAIGSWGKRWIDMRHHLDSAEENLLIILQMHLRKRQIGGLFSTVKSDQMLGILILV